VFKIKQAKKKKAAVEADGGEFVQTKVQDATGEEEMVETSDEDF
jgi:hypothetical protein